jgi:hypothetical protein
MACDYLQLGVRTFFGIAALWVSDSLCKPVMLWARFFKPWAPGSDLVTRPHNTPMHREFAVERAEAELRVIRRGP